MKAVVTILTAFLFACGGSGRPVEGEFQADALEIDGRYSQEIHFEVLGVRVPLRPNAYVRVDPPVADMEAHVSILLQEIGVTNTNLTYSSPARQGCQMHIHFRDGNECSFIWVIQDEDSRITKMRFEHEKYHAVCRLAPEAISTISARLSQIGFHANLSDYDEELAATLVGVLSLHLEGVSFKDIQGCNLSDKAILILQSSKALPSQTIQ